MGNQEEWFEGKVLPGFDLPCGCRGGFGVSFWGSSSSSESALEECIECEAVWTYDDLFRVRWGRNERRRTHAEVTWWLRGCDWVEKRKTKKLSVLVAAILEAYPNIDMPESVRSSMSGMA